MTGVGKRVCQRVRNDQKVMPKRDWNKTHRQNVVALHGSEPSEYPDLTEQIATSKGRSKVHGPWMRACASCGQYYPEDAYNEHARSCHPPSKAKKVKCRICGTEVDPTRLRTHMYHYHPKPGWANPPPKGVTVKCRYCRKKVKLRGLKDHNKMWHGWK